MKVKLAMRDKLANIRNIFTQHFDNYDIDKLGRNVTYGIGKEKGDKAISLKKLYYRSID